MVSRVRDTEEKEEEEEEEELSSLLLRTCFGEVLCFMSASMI